MANNLGNVTIEIIKKDNTNKDLSVEIDFNDVNLNSYVDVLRTVQKDVNQCITQIVQEESTKETDMVHNDKEDDEEDSEEEDDLLKTFDVKRKIAGLATKQKKKPKLTKR